MVNAEATKPEAPGTKERIMEAAISAFAERGFDGARVDDIAKRAKVNKALIYYYFESKEKILDSIFHTTLAEVMSQIGPAATDPTLFDDREKATALMDGLLIFLEGRQDVLRILMMESLKRSPVNDGIFVLVGKFLDDSFTLAGTPLSARDAARARIMEFFTGLIPILAYIVYHETWIQANGISEPELRAQFIDSFIDAHFTATQRLYAGISSDTGQ